MIVYNFHVWHQFHNNSFNLIKKYKNLKAKNLTKLGVASKL